MKIAGIEVTNFKGIEKISVDLRDGHTSIIGLNGSGKTTLIDVIRACIKGVSQKSSKGELVGERFRFIGSHKKTADLKITLKDEKGGFDVVITNKMTKASNGIEFKASDGSTLDRQWLNDFFNVAFLSAKNFIERTPKEQALLLGINTSEFDAEIKELKSAYKAINAVLRDFGAVEDIPKVERALIAKLMIEKEHMDLRNNDRDEAVKKIENAQAGARMCIVEADKAREMLDKALKRADAYQEEVKSLPIPTPKENTSEIIHKINNAENTNRAAEAYERNEEKRIAKDKKITELAANKIKQGETNDKRTGYIKAFDFKNDGLSVDEEGGLLLNGRRLSDFSKGEQEVIVAGLYASLDPELKVRIIDEFQSLDPANQKKIVDGLINKGFQVITLEVGDKKKDKNTILLRECKVVDESKEVKSDKPKLL